MFVVIMKTWWGFSTRVNMDIEITGL